MKQENDITEILEQVRQSETPAVELQDEAILREYQKQREDKSSLGIKIITVFGGLFATSTFMSFLMMTGIYNSGIGLLITGIIFIAGGIWLKMAVDKLIVDTCSITAFIVGFILLAMGLSDLKVDENIVTILFILLAMITLVITQTYILSFISVLIINGGLLALIINNDLFNLVHLYISVIAAAMVYWYLNEARFLTRGIKMSRLYDPVRIGLVFSFVIGLVFIGKKGLINISYNYIWLSSIVIIAAIMYVIYILLALFKMPPGKEKTIIYSLSFVLLLSTAMSPAIAGALLIILLAFMVNHKTGFAVGIISFIYFVSQYYYDLGYTLLVKSVLMFSTGILFMLIYLFTYKKLHTNEKI